MRSADLVTDGYHLARGVPLYVAEIVEVTKTFAEVEVAGGGVVGIVVSCGLDLCVCSLLAP